jgi:hypothetical protein
VAKPSVNAHFLQTFQVFTKFSVKPVRHHLGISSVHLIPLAIEEPHRDFIVQWVLHYLHNALNFLLVQVAGSSVRIDLCTFEDYIGISTANALDLGKGIHDFLLSVNISVQNT